MVYINIEDLLNNVNAIDHRTSKNKNKHKIYFSGESLSSEHIFKLLEHTKYIVNNNLKDFDLNIVINTPVISDEAVLILLEIITYYLLKNNLCNITYTFIVNVKLLGYGMLKENILFQYNTKKINRSNYIEKFEKGFELNFNHYRRICKNTNENREGIFLSQLLSEISTFLLPFDIEIEYADQLSEVIVEIIDNALNHSRSDCLLDIKVLHDEINKYTCLNVTTVSIGNILLSSKIKDYINNENKSKYSNKNMIVMKALNYHKTQFTEEYDLDSFALISAFQKYVTTRENSKNSGGTGLTTLIKQLREKSTKDYCYVLSGNDIIRFEDGYLDLTKDGLIGFNDNNDYINSIPSHRIVYKNEKKLNGVIYNLSFILNEREKNNE